MVFRQGHLVLTNRKKRNMKNEDLALGIAGAAAQGVAMATKSSTIANGVSTIVSGSTQAQAGATIVKGVAGIIKTIATIDPIDAAIIGGAIISIGALGAAIVNAEPMEFDDFDNMCAYADAHRL